MAGIEDDFVCVCVSVGGGGGWGGGLDWLQSPVTKYFSHNPV